MFSKKHQILCGGDPEAHFERLGVVAHRSFEGESPWHRARLTAWELDGSEFVKLCDEDAEVGEGFWIESRSWWTECGGSNLGSCDSEAVINGHRILCWNRRDQADGSGPEDYEWDHVLQYLCDHVGASTERNVASCLADLARDNQMTVGKLLELTLPVVSQQRN